MLYLMLLSHFFLKWLIIKTPANIYGYIKFRLVITYGYVQLFISISCLGPKRFLMFENWPTPCHNIQINN